VPAIRGQRSVQKLLSLPSLKPAFKADGTATRSLPTGSIKKTNNVI